MKKIFLSILLSAACLTGLPQQLTMEQAIKLARLPLKCINTEYPNKTSHLINDSTDANDSFRSSPCILRLSRLAQQLIIR